MMPLQEEPLEVDVDIEETTDIKITRRDYIVASLQLACR